MNVFSAWVLISYSKPGIDKKLEFLKKGFDRIAFFYDNLAALIYGTKLLEAKSALLPKNTEGSSFLIVGGGTGYSLSKILANNSNAIICNVDSSKRMQDASRKRIDELNTVLSSTIEYRNVSFEDYKSDEKFDFIVAPFFFDMFDENVIIKSLDKIKTLGKEGSVLIVTDFRMPSAGFNRFKAKILLWVMFRFFRFTTDIATNKLPDIEECLSSLKQFNYKRQMGDMLFSASYYI